MRIFRLLISAILLFTTPAYVLEMSYVAHIPKPIIQTPLTYDDFLKLLDLIESDAIENSTENELDQLNQLLAHYARRGALDENEILEIEQDIDELLASNNPFHYNLCQDGITAEFYKNDVVLCKSWMKKQAQHVKHFCRKHKKALIIGAVVVVAVVVVTCVVLAAPAAGQVLAGTAATTGGALVADEANSSQTNSSEISDQVQQKVESLKEILSTEELVETQDATFPIEENGRLLGDVLARQTLDELAQNYPITNNVDGMSSIDYAFLPNFTGTELGHNFNENIYQLRGSYALESGHYDQAISDLNQAISLNPTNYNPYLDRSMAYLQKGDYEHGFQDYESYVEKRPSSLENSIDFMYGFSKGLPRGSIDSGAQYGTFVKDALIHPIDTSIEMGQAVATLTRLAASQEWKTISQAIAPEVVDLVENWNNLSAYEKGEGMGYAFAKHGTDLLIPGATAKLISKGIAGAQELAEVGKNLKTAAKVLAIETLETHSLAEIGLVETKTLFKNPLVDVEKFAKAGEEIDRAGLTKAGRALMKHGYRENTIYPKPMGSPGQINEHGQKILEQILNHPDKTILLRENKRYGKYIDIEVKGAGGVRYTENGKFITFLEPRN